MFLLGGTMIALTITQMMAAQQQTQQMGAYGGYFNGATGLYGQSNGILGSPVAQAGINGALMGGLLGIFGGPAGMLGGALFGGLFSALLAKLFQPQQQQPPFPGPQPMYGIQPPPFPGPFPPPPFPPPWFPPCCCCYGPPPLPYPHPQPPPFPLPQQGGQLKQDGAGKPITYTSHGGYQVKVDGHNVYFTTPDGKHTVQHWGDPHERVDGKDLKDWDAQKLADGTDRRTIILGDGTKVTMSATGPQGVITGVSIYDGAQSIQIDNQKNQVKEVSFDPNRSLQSDINQVDGEASFLGYNAKGEFAYQHVYSEYSTGNVATNQGNVDALTSPSRTVADADARMRNYFTNLSPEDKARVRNIFLSGAQRDGVDVNDSLRQSAWLLESDKSTEQEKILAMNYLNSWQFEKAQYGRIVTV